VRSRVLLETRLGARGRWRSGERSRWGREWSRTAEARCVCLSVRWVGSGLAGRVGGLLSLVSTILAQSRPMSSRTPCPTAHAIAASAWVLFDAHCVG
jgi:hypothetical protein